MEPNLTPQYLTALPVQLIETGTHVLIKRGRLEFHIRGGAGTAQLVQQILAAAGAGTHTPGTLRELFPAPWQPAIEALINALRERRILVRADDVVDPSPVPDPAVRTFYWHFGTNAGEVDERLKACRLLIVGVNQLAARLIACLRRFKPTGVAWLDDPLLRSPDLFDSSGTPLVTATEVQDIQPHRLKGDLESIAPESFDCLVVTSDAGSMARLRRWNEYCHLHRKAMFPVFLQDLLGYIGPFIQPEQTACFECFSLRRLTHSVDPSAYRAIADVDGERSAMAALIAPMVDAVGALAAMELLKHYGLGGSLWPIGKLVEVDVMTPSVSTRTVLRLPRCPVCCPVSERPNRQTSFAPGPALA